jgi:hypothetical protein
MLKSLLKLEFKKIGYDIEIKNILSELSKINQIKLVLEDNYGKKHTKSIITNCKGMYRKYMDKYNLFKYIR